MLYLYVNTLVHTRSIATHFMGCQANEYTQGIGLINTVSRIRIIFYSANVCRKILGKEIPDGETCHQ
jgi:hypothetical protein